MSSSIAIAKADRDKDYTLKSIIKELCTTIYFKNYSCPIGDSHLALL